jgi:hypothetical protein
LEVSAPPIVTILARRIKRPGEAMAAQPGRVGKVAANAPANERVEAPLPPGPTL